MNRFSLSLLLLPLLLRADFNAAKWQKRARLTVTAGSTTSNFVVGQDLFRGSSAQLNDLRIVLDDNYEVPYALRLLTGQVQQNERAVLIRDKGWSEQHGVQAVLDLQERREHNRLRIATEQHNFKQTVMVETSDDARHWSTVLSDGVVFDITRPEVKVSNLTVTYPTSTRRYVRVTIPGWTDPAFLESAWLAEHKETDSTRDTIARLQPAVTQHQDLQTTDLLFDLGFSGQPCDRLSLKVAPGLFSRSVEIATGNDPKVMPARAGAYIDRTSEGEHLDVEWGETWDRYIKLSIFNADSAPLAFGPATASVLRRVVQFPSTKAGTYWLYLDNPTARAPYYDFARVVRADSTASAATVGAFELNPAFQPELPPYSERKPWVFNVILGVAVAIMAFVTYRFARKATSPKA